MRRALALASVFIGIPTAVSGQPKANIYLDCDVLRRYSIPDDRQVGERLNFKIDQEASTIYQFDFDTGLYEKTCIKRYEGSDFSQMIGTCSVNDEYVSFIYTRNSIFFHETQYVRIFRGSGRLSGNLSMYNGPYKDSEWDPSKRPMAQYAIDGSCARGKDMSAVERAF